MKTTPLLFGLLASTCLWNASASADDGDPCVEAASKGQQLRDAHQLVEAREQFRLCGAAQCPAAVQGACATRLAEVESALPSVVLTARDRSGADLVDISVSVDGEPLLQRLNGLSVAMNAGPHTFRFERPGVGSLERVVTVKGGEKHQLVAVTFDVSASAPGPTAQNGAGADAAPNSDSAGNSPGKTVGWAMGGAGVVALGLAAVSGLIAVVNKAGAHCDSSGVCDPDTVSRIKSAALLSDIGWVTGGVLLAGGVSLILFAPTGPHGQTAAIRLVPVVTPSGGGVVAGARW